MRRTLPDGLHLGRRDHGLIPVIAAVTAIATLALGGWNAARSLSQEWAHGAAQQVTIEIPNISGDAQAVSTKLVAVLKSDPGIEAVEILPDAKVQEILRPWLGAMQANLADLPVILSLTRRSNTPLTDLPVILDTIAPSAIIEDNVRWGERLMLLGQSLQACAWLAVILAGFATAGVTTLSVRMTLIARRRTVEILHSLGARDGLIARRIAWRSAVLGVSGGLLGTLLGGATLAILHRLIQPFLDQSRAGLSIWPQGYEEWMSLWSGLPSSLFHSLASVPLLVAALSFIVAQVTVRLWLRRLP
ncbi:cell division protein FtsX [Asaia krungthepensis]|uniref:Cell division protein FtsX n=1 Tax=Asaia krungthepensis NRIC 0535 TaxID=1307925 RepID=A0ABQ0PYC5_9PROT|nr:FtsX-like permease family protein [Asaia krungthepensis]GBQ84644.1 cell division protein FtsX [Asaia krungthepensis NRIC 0535]